MTTEIDKLVEVYLASHPGYQYPPSGDRHPAILAIGEQMKPWLVERLGGPLLFWRAMLDSARSWFAPGCDSREFRLFCYFFEAEANIFWGGRPEYEALSLEYDTWRRSMIVAKDVVNESEILLADASRASVWIPWYFKRRARTFITAPLFLLFVFCIAVSIFGATIQGLALLRASHAVFGFIGAFITISFGWIPVILPPVLYYSLVKNLPGLWLRQDASRRAKALASVAVLVLLPLGAHLSYRAANWGIGAIADHNPCAALAAGVAASEPPTSCP